MTQTNILILPHSAHGHTANTATWYTGLFIISRKNFIPLRPSQPKRDTILCLMKNGPKCKFLLHGSFAIDKWLKWFVCRRAARKSHWWCGSLELQMKKPNWFVLEIFGTGSIGYSKASQTRLFFTFCWLFAILLYMIFHMNICKL